MKQMKPDSMSTYYMIQFKNKLMSYEYCRQNHGYLGVGKH